MERIRNVPPADVDVVTFTALGDVAAQQEMMSKYPELFTPESKAKFGVDHYFVPTDKPLGSRQARKIGYWSSMWSHQRETFRWKGFVTIELGVDDTPAIEWLSHADANSEAER